MKEGKEKHEEDFQVHLLCINYFCAVIGGKRLGYLIGPHNELRKVNESEF